MKWEDILENISNYKSEFLKSYKCLNQNRSIKNETVLKHLSILKTQLENIRILSNTLEKRLTPDRFQILSECYFSCRDKLIKILSKFQIDVEVPNNFQEPFTIDIQSIILPTLSEEDSTDTDEENSNNMAQTVTQFLCNAAKLLPDFDGKPENLQSFLDAIELVELIKETHEAVAVNLVKSKLKGTARNLITNETTLAAVRLKLKSAVKGESVEVLTAKILNTKQNGKNATTYSNEIESLAKSLEAAYISDGLTPELSTKYSTQIALKAIAKNCNNERVKLIMESGTFSTMNEGIAKFVNSCTETTSQQNSILFVKKNNDSNNIRRGGYNGNSRGQNRGRGRYNNHNNRNSGNTNNYQNRNQERRYNNNNQRHTNNIRLVGNEPQLPENLNQPLRD